MIQMINVKLRNKKFLQKNFLNVTIKINLREKMGSLIQPPRLDLMSENSNAVF